MSSEVRRFKTDEAHERTVANRRRMDEEQAERELLYGEKLERMRLVKQRRQAAADEAREKRASFNLTRQRLAKQLERAAYTDDFSVVQDSLRRYGFDGMADRSGGPSPPSSPSCASEALQFRPLEPRPPSAPACSSRSTRPFSARIRQGTSVACASAAAHQQPGGATVPLLLPAPSETQNTPPISPSGKSVHSMNALSTTAGSIASDLTDSVPAVWTSCDSCCAPSSESIAAAAAVAFGAGASSPPGSGLPQQHAWDLRHELLCMPPCGLEQMTPSSCEEECKILSPRFAPWTPTCSQVPAEADDEPILDIPSPRFSIFASPGRL